MMFLFLLLFANSLCIDCSVDSVTAILVKTAQICDKEPFSNMKECLLECQEEYIKGFLCGRISYKIISC